MCRCKIAYILLLLILSQKCSSATTTCNPNDRIALDGILNECHIKQTSSDCCQWEAVQCDKGRVQSLSLEFCTCNAAFLSESTFFNLPFLRSFSIENSKNCTISDGFSKLKNLRSLSLNGFAGTIPPSIGKLRKLQSLILSENLTGTIPETIGNLRKLKFLNFNGNSFTGGIPDSIGNLQNLTFLSIVACGVTGDLPDSLGNLHRLNIIALNENRLTGKIPDSFANLTELTHLELGRNQLTGSVPVWIFELPNLQHLGLSSNRLTGTLPESISSDSHITALFIENNNLEGTVPAWLFLRSITRVSLANNSLGPVESFPKPEVSYLESVNLNNNKLQRIPSSLFNLANITDLSLGANELTGVFDFYMLKEMTRLENLNLSSNLGLTVINSGGPLLNLPQLRVLQMDFCGLTEFPSFLSDLSGLTYLDVSDNKLKGTIDFSKGWSSLQSFDASYNMLEGSLMAVPPSLLYLFLSHNQFDGPIPESYCSLIDLDLSFNRLTDPIPKCFSAIRVLLLSNNFFRSELPRSLINSTNLQFLDVGNNQITDVFPGWLGDLPTVVTLIISSNNFFGEIAKPTSSDPFPSLVIFDASYNKFEGRLPAEYILSIDYFPPWDRITDTFWDRVYVRFKGQRSLVWDLYFSRRRTAIFTFVDLSNNRFSGSIPSSIGNLGQLTGLNLNDNSLTGEIPPSFGNLTSIESLDLSSNKLTGIVPEELMNLKALVYLNLSNNQFDSTIPAGKSSSSASFVGN